MGVISRVGAGEFPVVFPAYPWLLDIDEVEVIPEMQVGVLSGGQGVHVPHSLGRS